MSLFPSICVILLSVAAAAVSVRRSYQDVSFQKQAGLDGDADAGLAVALHVAEREESHKALDNRSVSMAIMTESINADATGPRVTVCA